MSIFKELNRNPSPRDRVELALVAAVGLGLLGAFNHFGWHLLFLTGKPERAPGLWIAGAVLAVLSLIPPIGRRLYVAWMGLGLLIGFFTSPIIMFVVYVVAVVPLGVAFRLMRRDTMRRQLDPAAKTYWEDYPRRDDPGSYVKQF